MWWPNTLSESIHSMELRNPELLPDLRRGETIFIFSDYSGQQPSSDFYVYSFLFVDINHCHEWFKKINLVREGYLSDGRRMSFKNLKDRQRDKALHPFLNAANIIPGLVITFLVDKRISTLVGDNQVDLDNNLVQVFGVWKKAVLETLLKIMHFNCLMISGLSRENQDIYWVTDNDDFTSNDVLLNFSTNIFAHFINHYLSHNLRHIRFGPLKYTDDGSRKLEDFCAIPDLVSGTLSEICTGYNKLGVKFHERLIIPRLESISTKSKRIMNWLSDDKQNLKRLTCMISSIENSNRLNITWLKFIGYKIEGGFV